MNAYEMVSARLKRCASIDGSCDDCEYSDECNINALLRAAAEVIDGYLYPNRCSAFDREEVIENCTVEVWKNSITGECSWGWYRGRKEDTTRLELRGSES